MADKIPIPSANGPSEAPLVRTSEPRKMMRTDSRSDNSIVKHRVYTKEPSFKEKLKRSFIKEDITNLRDYIVFDVLIPNVKKVVFDTIVGTIGQALGMQIPKYSSSILSTHSRQSTGYRDYTAIASRTRDPIRERNESSYDRLQIRDLVFESKEEALSLLELMTDICDTNRVVSVFTFYEKAGIREGNHYTNKNWGWRTLNGAGVTSVNIPDFPDGIGYIIDLPPAKPI